MANPDYGVNGGRLPGPTGYGQQAPTLSAARSAPLGILPRERLELTSFPTMFGSLYRMMDGIVNQPEKRRNWYLQKLGKYHDQLQESAIANRIPMQVLAVIILNELADIDQRDWLQQQLITHLNSGSLGIAQINVKTALDHQLLRGFLVGRNGGTAAQLLAVPQYSIEAAAREIRHLLDLMERSPGSSWPAFFKFAPPSAEDRDPTRYYRSGVITVEGKSTEEDREALFARMVGSAYNGGDKFLGVTDPQASAPNSWIHGRNAEFIARDLFKFDLFRSRAFPKAEETKPTTHKVIIGETLSKLAQTYYKDEQLWPIIYDANQSSVGPDPNHLKVGQELVMPDLSSMNPAKLADAKRRAAQVHSSPKIPLAPPR